MRCRVHLWAGGRQAIQERERAQAMLWESDLLLCAYIEWALLDQLNPSSATESRAQPTAPGFVGSIGPGTNAVTSSSRGPEVRWLWVCTLLPSSPGDETLLDVWVKSLAIRSRAGAQLCGFARVFVCIVCMYVSVCGRSQATSSVMYGRFTLRVVGRVGERLFYAR